MLEQLWSRFDDESGSWVYDPAMHLSYHDRKRITDGQSAEVAEEKLTTIARSLRGLKTAAAAGLVLLLGGAILMALSVLDVVSISTLEEIVSPLSIAFSMGAGTLAGLWRGLRLERQKLLCELVLAYSEESPVSESPIPESEPAP